MDKKSIFIFIIGGILTLFLIWGYSYEFFEFPYRMDENLANLMPEIWKKIKFNFRMIFILEGLPLVILGIFGLFHKYYLTKWVGGYCLVVGLIHTAVVLFTLANEV